MDVVSIMTMTIQTSVAYTHSPQIRERERGPDEIGLANAVLVFDEREPFLDGGQYYRSQAEASIGRELARRMGAVFTVNAKVSTTGGVCIEADFMVFWNGKCGILEVNGPHHDAMTDHKKARQFQRQGFTVFQFFSADECYKNPRLVVDEFFRILATSR